jgi:hypothetical protein
VKKLFTFAALSLCAFALNSGCAIAPRGPKVSRTITDITTEKFSSRPDGLVWREAKRVTKIEDGAFTRGWYFFTDPSLHMVCAWHTNAAELGGGSRFMAGGAGIMVDSNTAAILGAAGTAAGNVAGAIDKTMIK